MVMIKDIGRLLLPADSALPVQPRVRSWSRTPEYTNIFIFQNICLASFSRISFSAQNIFQGSIQTNFIEYIFYILVEDT